MKHLKLMLVIVLSGFVTCADLIIGHRSSFRSAVWILMISGTAAAADVLQNKLLQIASKKQHLWFTM